MKALDVVNYFNEIRPNSFDNDTKIGWLKDVEHDIVYQRALHGNIELDEGFMEEENPDLTLGREWRDLYVYYMISMADMTNGEMRLYSVSSVYFNSLFDKWKRRERARNMPYCTISIRI